jgi:pimeloyl-ACP methyl ester carboxylesterase
MHTTVGRRAKPLGRIAPLPASGLTGLVYRTVQGGFRLAGAGVDALLGPLEHWAPQGPHAPAQEALVAVVNGVYGDYLERTSNPLALQMSLRLRGIEIDPCSPAAALQTAGSAPSFRLLVLVHGLCMNDRQWCREGHDHGEALAQALGCSALNLRYNSGRPVHVNGRQFGELLKTVIAHWPVSVDELVIVGFSMGGLVARSACAQAGEHGQAWLGKLRKLVFLGTPHFGSPLERGGHALDMLLGLSPYSAPLGRAGKMRSAGIRGWATFNC